VSIAEEVFQGTTGVGVIGIELDDTLQVQTAMARETLLATPFGKFPLALDRVGGHIAAGFVLFVGRELGDDALDGGGIEADRDASIGFDGVVVAGGPTRVDKDTPYATTIRKLELIPPGFRRRKRVGYGNECNGKQMLGGGHRLLRSSSHWAFEPARAHESESVGPAGVTGNAGATHPL
jgi:hypothetical protein